MAERVERVLVTGANGFIGSRIAVRLREAGYHVVGLLRSSRGNKRLPRGFPFVMVDISQPLTETLIHVIGSADVIVHTAAETHVTRSIVDAEPFVRANVLGTMNVLDYAVRCEDLRLFVQFSTDEVFGPCLDGEPFADDARYDSRNPYAATKAGAEEMALAYANTYGLPVIITHCCNVFGEQQHAEKFVPLATRAILRGQPLRLHGASTTDGTATREWTYVGNVARAVEHALAMMLPESGCRIKWNIGCGVEKSVLELAWGIAGCLGMADQLKYEIVEPAERPGNDECYRSDCSGFLATGYAPAFDYETALGKTVQWYRDNPRWLEV